MKRILVYGMTNNPGGIESYLLFMMDKLLGYNIQMDFISDFPTIAYEKELISKGARIYHIPAKGKNLIKHWKEFSKVLKEHPEYETVYFNVLDAGAVFTALAPRLKGRNIIVHSHNGNTDKVMLHRLCKPFLGLIANKYVACSKLAADYMFGKKKREKVLIIPNAIDADKYTFDLGLRQEYRKELQIEENFVVCHIGRVTRQKNPYGVLNIFDKVYHKDKSAVLLYVGTGDMIDEMVDQVNKRNTLYEEECKDSGFKAPIRLLGVRNDIPAIMQAADVMLLPSLYEGLPIVAIEAQAAGLPTFMSENITREVKITDDAEYISLELSPGEWADKILAYKGRERRDNHQLIQDAGYDKNTMIKVLEEFVEWL